MRGRVEPIHVPLKEPFRIATGEVTTAANVLYHVTQDGVTGVGEATPFEVITGGTQAKVQSDLATVPSEFAFSPGQPVDATLGTLGANQFGPDARHALDVALHDWAARRQRVPLATLLGRSPRPLPTSITIPLVPLDQVAVHVRRGLDQGFRIFKIKSKSGVDVETQRIGIVRDVAGAQAELRVDANAGWSLQEARQMVPALRRADVRFLEQPLKRDDLPGHAQLVKEGGVPIMVDESVFTLDDARRVHAAKAAHMFNVKLAKSGGIAEAMKILDYARENDIDCMVGCMIQTRVAISADAHVAAAAPAVKHVDLDGHTFLASDPVQGGVTIEKGILRFPDSHGHGATFMAHSSPNAAKIVDGRPAFR